MLPRPRLLGALFLGGALFTYGATSEVAWLFLFAYLVWAATIAAYLYAIWNDAGIRPGIRVIRVEPGPDTPSQEVPEGMFRDAPLPAPLFEGDAVVVELALDSDAGARGPARLSARVGGVELDSGTATVPAKGWRSQQRLGPLRRGILEAEGVVLEVGDPIGFFRRRRRGEQAVLGSVLPLFTSLSDLASVREVESVLTAARPGHGSELYGVREYRAGDPLRRIHWKTSARRGELVVRELEPPGLRVVCLVMETSPASRAVADQLARLAASEAWDCIRAGGRVAAWAPGFEALPAATGGSLWAVLDWLARYPDLPSDTQGDAPHAGEVIGFCSEPRDLDPELVRLRARGVDVRAWVVGEANLSVPHQRAGVQWPL